MDSIEQPPLLTNAEGAARTVGVEIEFGSLGAEDAARLVRSMFGGKLVEHGSHTFEIKGSTLGDFAVKLDTRLVSYQGDAAGFAAEIQQQLADWFGSVASLVVPFEIVAPPVTIEKLADLDEVIANLRKAGAGGTDASPFFAFGLHLNPEAPRLEPRSLVSIVKAYALVSPWLWRVVDPDSTRRLLSFAEPYPEAYVRTLTASDYWPDMPTFIDDYLDANPTRNRDLDLLPLLTFVDEERVRSRLPAEKISARPTFHYRLPNILLDDPDWGIVLEWNRWVTVERLACDDERLAALGQTYNDHQGTSDSWIAHLEALDIA